MRSSPLFPPGFVWGAATAAYQIEGGFAADGKGLSIWDYFARRTDLGPGGMHEGCNGEVACDHYHRAEEDVAMMREIGLQAYRFSVSWPRVVPEGTGRPNAAGLDFYDRLVDRLLAAGVQPWVTLYHWDLPLALQRRGGWLNRDSASWFAEYASLLAGRLGDRVGHWITLNEIQNIVGGLLHGGWLAPGDKLPWSEVLLAGHHLLLAHSRAVQALRAAAPGAIQVGWAPGAVMKLPGSETPEDIAAARHANFELIARAHDHTAWWCDPVYLGRYPESGLRVFGPDAPPVAAGDMELIRQPLDFLGVNIYGMDTVRAGPDGPELVRRPDGFPTVRNDQPVTPGALYWGPRFLHERYGLPVVVTENGMAGLDWITLDGSCPDPLRIDYTARYLRELSRAHADGVPLGGYFHWSWMDNLEWAGGYRHRFGLVHVDFATGQRTFKDSARWYGRVIRSHGAELGA